MQVTKRDKVWLTPEQVDAMLTVARKRDLGHYALLLLMRWGLRVGEIVGHQDRTVYTRWKDKHNHALGKEQAVSIVNLPGLCTQDVRREEQGVWVKGKGGTARLVPMPETVIYALIAYLHAAGFGAGSKLFDISETTAEKLVRDYARLAGVPDWNRKGFGPHRLRAFTATDAKDKGLSTFQIRDVMRHSNVATTERYVGRSTPSQLRNLVSKLAGETPPNGEET